MTPEVLQAAALYADIAHAQLTGDSLHVEISPEGYDLDISSVPLVNIDRAIALLQAKRDRLAHVNR